jgi:hypothetical protein
MSDNNIEITRLRNEMHAQTEAYVEFNNALVRIYELQKDIKAYLERMSTSDDREVRELYEKIAAMMALLKEYQQSQTKGDESMTDEIESFNAVLSNFGGEFEIFKAKIEQLVSDEGEQSCANREAVTAAAKSIIDGFASLSEGVKSSYADLSKRMDDIKAAVEPLTQARAGWSEWKKRIGWTIAGISIIVAILMGMAQVGAYKVEFFPHDDTTYQKPVNTINR